MSHKQKRGMVSYSFSCLINVTVNESVPVYQGLPNEWRSSVKEAILNPKVMKFAQDLIMKRADLQR